MKFYHWTNSYKVSQKDELQKVFVDFLINIIIKIIERVVTILFRVNQLEPAEPSQQQLQPRRQDRQARQVGKHRLDIILWYVYIILL